MLKAIVPIVEGQGDEKAVPLLLRKLLGEMNRWDIQIIRPKNAHGRSNLEKEEGLERFIQIALTEPGCAAILVLIDADENCAKQLAERFAERVRAAGVTVPVVIVCAKCEYEAWLLASLETMAGKDLKGKPGLPSGLQFEGDVESIRSVKGWLSRHFPGTRNYKEDSDQAPMTELLDTTMARQNSRSFRRLHHAIEQIVEAMNSGKVVVTP